MINLIVISSVVGYCFLGFITVKAMMNRDWNELSALGFFVWPIIWIIFVACWIADKLFKGK